MDGRAVNLSLGLESKHVCVELKPRRVEEVRQWRGPPRFNSFGGWSVTCGAFRVEKCSRPAGEGDDGICMSLSKMPLLVIRPTRLKELF
jgi:hypothetical protein